MKITRERVDIFKPITIILESDAEAELMWQLLNISTSAVEEDYCREKYKVPKEIKTAMWSAFDRVYPYQQGLAGVFDRESIELV